MFHLDRSKYKIESINIELTNICNLSCKMCYRNSMTYKQGIMAYDTFKYIVDKICDSELDVKNIFLHWRGEPLIVEYLPNAIEYIKKKLKVSVILFTNGTKLTDNLSEKILVANIDVVNFSIDSNTEDKYREIRKDYSIIDLKQNINNFIKLRNKLNSNTKINIYSVLLEDNIGELIDIKKEWEQKVDNVVIKSDMSGDSLLSIKSDKKCFWPFKNLIVGWDGNVSPCCMDINMEMVLGNILEESFESIFNGKDITNIREGILNNNTKSVICHKCNFYKGR